MASRSGTNSVDLWSQVVGTEEEDQHQEPRFTFTYRHKKTDKDAPIMKQLSSHKENRVSFAPVKRISWNRSLSTRGRTSIAAAACVDYRHQREKPKRKTKPVLPRGKVVPPPNFERERAYFQEVDSFELLEESPSPKKSGTRVMGESEHFDVSHISSVLKKWLVTRKLFPSCPPSGSLSRILETPALSNESSGLKAFEKVTVQTFSSSVSIQSRTHSSAVLGNRHSSTSTTEILQPNGGKHWEDVEIGIRNLSLASPPSLDGQAWDPFHALLAVCGQSAPSQFSDVLYAYCDPENISKVGEGTYGEVFLAGDTVCKIVPFDGDSLVNGEVQKKSEDLLEEAVLSLTLNRLRGHEGNNNNVCPTFIETINLRVCEGPYDAAMIKAWEEWDNKHCSENDHPMDFAKKQRFVIFVQEHGGQDLESFVLHNFNEARSLLVQVTVAMAVAEAGLQFEHRDLHWGNILISRKGSETLDFILDGRQIKVKTFGLSILIIDFTLSRINNGEDILFLDLSSDPAIFEGPKGDKQSETYRKMKEVTGDCWEGSFPKTNVLWLQYLVDILLLKKSYDRSSKDERELRSLKKRLNNYGSAKEAADDPFFGDMLVGGAS